MKCSFNFVLDFDFFSLHVCICIYNVCKKRVVKGNAEILDFDSFDISILQGSLDLSNRKSYKVRYTIIV